jgi:NADPH-dependent 2,4-dienoyl-CoA reductase/sulfur reductase-like enzyme
LTTNAQHYVIVGNSIAGIEAAITIRNRDREAKITVISYEHAHPFARVSLMYLFCGQLSLKDTQFYPEDLYDRMRFQRVLDRVVSVDPTGRTLALQSGASLGYDKLLLAVGSTARRLTWAGAYDEPRFVHHFVTLPDLRALDAAARPGMSVAVIGGGLIGVEVAEIMHMRGLRTHFLIREPWYFPVALDPAEAEVVALHIRNHGVDCRTDNPVDGFDRRGGKIVLKGAQEIEVDLVVGAIGVVPATGFLEGSGIVVNRETGGVETADNLESTSAPGVYAAGDCAQVSWVDGSRRPEQLWYTSRDQGRAAAAAMLGDDVKYRRGTWYNSAKFFDVEYTTAGYLPSGGRVCAASDGWQTWFQQVPGKPVTQRIVVKHGVVKGFNSLGTRWDHGVWMRWIQERRPLDWVLQHMDEARFDEEFMEPFRVLPTATLTGGA